MRTAQKIKINYNTRAAYELASSLPCPQSVNDVYNLGISLHYCVRARYLEIAELLNDKTFLLDLAAQQLDIKAEIEKLAVYNTNVQLSKFYAQGGPIMEHPIDNAAAKQIQPFFSRIVSRFLVTLDELVNQVLTRKISALEMPAAVNQQMAETYENMQKMFQDQEMADAFEELSKVIPS